MKKQSYPHGKLLTNKAFSSYLLTEKWIQQKQFLKYENVQFQLGKKGRKRNQLYCFDYEPESCNVVMKVSQISQHYKLGRKINLFLTSLFKDYNHRSYVGSVQLQQAGVDTIMPIAYWTFKSSFLKRKSYLLYQKVESHLTVNDLCKHILQSKVKNKDILIETIASQCADIVKKVHAANVRHDDPHGHNILTNFRSPDLTLLNVEKIINTKFTLIDNDRCTLAHTATPPPLKRFFDLKCLVRFRICELPKQKLLRLYLGDEYRACWWHVFSFWDSGGFNIRKRLSSLLKQAR